MKKLLFFVLLPMLTFAQKKPIYLGADLSYVNEIEDCGASFQSKGKKVDPYKLFAQKGSNLVRLRLWHSPEINSYSGFADVKKSIKRAKATKTAVLLDFHYSDTWADPEKQFIPKAWSKITDLNVLGDSLYNYTLNTLLKLNSENLLPEMVQVGNETNQEILQPDKTHKKETDWKRNAFLFNKGISAVREASKITGRKIEILLHIAQPENALKWFASADKNGIKDYDFIGISYYPLWSEYKFDRLPEAVKTLVDTYKKKFLIVETAYPYTMENVDSANNILDNKALIDGYPVSPSGQKKYMVDLTKIVVNAGGNGVIYWEPAWVTSNCKTLWGQGSHWENATFFDSKNHNEALEAFDFYDIKHYKK
ncbi:glycosyl hydrolase 53 family protein [Flavobacterium sp.]|uniref:glycoside hydrolase family 53 protein n=1 Tax=Flavobacterium sp. TaxID=239 RepID=UPI0011F89D44|nr:glycosyl hydrolase 53 family protein [Flavobacterium sp.]RZJ73341.1 MAG: arabinogalactan endo-1,4-beta-galactosidase [Flavobacterium sp.]